MSTSSLFSDYFNRSKKTDYASSEYQCTGVISEDKNKVVFGDKDIELRNSNDELIVKFDLSDIISENISEYAINSIVINPGEAVLLKGLELGKSYEELYFQIPEKLIAYDNWQNYINVEFDITYINNLIKKSLNIRSIDPSMNPYNIVDRVNSILKSLEIPNITFSIEKENNVYFFKFLSALDGYEFKISFLKLYPVWQENEYPLSPFMDSSHFETQLYSSNIDNDVYKNIKLSEDNISIPENLSNYKTAYYNSGYYGKKDMDSSIYYKDFTENENLDTSILGNTLDDSIYDSSSDAVDIYLNHFKDPSFIDGSVLYNSDASAYTYYYPLDCCINHYVAPYKYPNGAARVWMISTEFPDISAGIPIISLKMNHVSDIISVFSDNGNNTYKKNIIGVKASNRDLRENTGRILEYPLIEDISLNNITPSDISSFSLVRNVNFIEDVSSDTILSYPEYYLGMYGYLSLITEYGLWENMGDEYSVFTKEDNKTDNVKNLSNSIFVYNSNVFPVKLNYFIAD